MVLLLSQPRKIFHREIKILSSLAAMRIRKRQVPFPLSSLSPVPLSDPLLNRSPVVQLQLHDPIPAHPLANLTSPSGSHAHFHNQPSDQPNHTIGGGSGLDCSDDAGGSHKEEKKLRKDYLVSEIASYHYYYYYFCFLFLSFLLLVLCLFCGGAVWFNVP